MLDKAQMVWFSWFLGIPNQPGRIMKPMPYELYCWAMPKRDWEGYPNLFLVTWPGHE